MSSVVFVTPSLRGGGAEKVLVDIANGLAGRGFDVEIISLAGGTDRNGLSDGIAVKILDRDGPSADRGMLAKVIRRLRILVRLGRQLSALPRGTDIIGFLEPIAVYLWFFRIILGGEYAVSLHIHESIFYRQAFAGATRRRLEAWLLKRACSAARWVTIPSEGCRQDLIVHFGVPMEKVHTVPNPVDIEKIKVMARQAVQLPEAWIGGRMLFVHVARLMGSKNHHLLVEACRTLRKRTEDFAVLCIGEGELRAEIQARIDREDLAGHICLLGEKENPYAFMRLARGLLLTSAYESFGLVLVEAMASGTPVIATDCPSGPSDVLEGGRDGLLVPPADPGMFADAMLRLTKDDDLRRNLVEMGLERCEAFRPEKIITGWVDLLSRQG